MAAGGASQVFGKDDLSFVKALPEHVEIECPVCLQVMLTDPHLVTCCGHHFCATCIERVRDSNRPCPMCKEINYQAFVDKNTLRIISGLQVHCINNGCQWKGDLKNLSTHLSKGKREGQCQFEEVKCRYVKCQEKKQRCNLDNHEMNNCPHRPYRCQYCTVRGTYLSIIKEHYDNCPNYPVSCLNKCKSFLPRSHLDNHLSKECPLQPVECPFSWAGCTDKPLRKDSKTHTTDLNHMSLLAVACGQLKKENEKVNIAYERLNTTCAQLKKRNEQLAVECKELRDTNEKLEKATHIFHNAVTDNYQVLPVTINKGSPPVHVYTHMFGHHISVRYIAGLLSGTVYIAFHEGKFDKIQPKIPKISAKDDDILYPLAIAVLKKTPFDILVTTTKGLPSVLSVETEFPPPLSVDIVMSWD